MSEDVRRKQGIVTVRSLTFPFPARPFALPLAIVVYAACAAALAPQTFEKMLGAYLVLATCVLVLGLPIVAIAVWPRSPLSSMWDLLRRRGAILVLTAVLFCIGLSGYTTFKLAIPDLVPFYADPFLADLDAWIHGGDPGMMLHRLVPLWAQYPIGIAYGPTWYLLWFGLAAFVALSGNGGLQQRYFWAMALVVFLVGTVLAAALSSVGPIFYDQFYSADRFGPLLLSIKDSALGAHQEQVSAYLLEQGELPHVGTGISAMPSMHLAIVTLNAWMLGSLSRRIGLLAWIYVGLILIGSVHLAWHYALDGYVSIAMVSLIWWGTGRAFAVSAPRRLVGLTSAQQAHSVKT
jgi:hypothetical protein